MSDIRVINRVDEDNPFLVIYKDRGLATAPLHEGDDSALTKACDIFPQINSVIGRKPVEKGLVHRIDTLTDGLVLIALTQQAYDFFLQEQTENRFKKWYRAECDYVRNISDYSEGFPFTDFELKDQIASCISDNKEIFFKAKSSFRSFGPKGRLVRPVTEMSSFAVQKHNNSKKDYVTDVCFDGKNAICSLSNGYRHQVRCHLAWNGLPIKGDPLYNPLFKEGDIFSFTAFKLSFLHPLTKELLTFSI